MSRQPAVAEIFEYNPEGINLIGFPSTPVLNALGRSLGTEVLLKGNQVEVGGKSFVYPSFHPEFVEKRQAFFRRVKSSSKVKKTFFDRGIPDLRGFSRNRSYQNFLRLCEEVYDTLETAREELKPFGHMPEARGILRKIDGFDSGLEEMLKTLKRVDETHTFAVDTQRGLVAFISEMPEEGISFVDRNSYRSLEWEEEMFYDLRLKMKKGAIEIAKEMGLEFQRGILKYVRDEFKFSPGKINLRSYFEQLALPARLDSRYDCFLESCRNYSAESVREDLEFYSADGADSRVFLDMLKRLSKSNSSIMPEPVYARFSNHYDIRGLFPPTLMDRYSSSTPFIPIDFKTKPSEKKILLAGLHSGGKSFFLENLVLASIIAQVGEDFPAELLTLPKYNRIFFYTNKGAYQGGKLETEIHQLNSIIDESRKGDLLVIDEFLDSASAEIANTLAPAILERLMKIDSTVIVTSHRCTNYESLVRSGWTLMTPEYKIDGEEVIPQKKLVRGFPNHEVNLRYVQGRYQEICGVRTASRIS